MVRFWGRMCDTGSELFVRPCDWQAAAGDTDSSAIRHFRSAGQRAAVPCSAGENNGPLQITLNGLNDVTTLYTRNVSFTGVPVE